MVLLRQYYFFIVHQIALSGRGQDRTPVTLHLSFTQVTCLSTSSVNCFTHVAHDAIGGMLA
jgi:hypothetical protein